MSSRYKMTRVQLTGLSLVIAILFIDMLLYSLIIPVTPYLTQKLQPSSTLTGILFSSYAIALFAFTPILGPLSDRIGRKKPILIGLAGMTLSTLLFAYAETMWMLIGARFLQGIAAAATWTAALALLADLFPPKMRGGAMGTALTGMSLGTLLGAPFGGWLLDFGGYAMPFYFAAGLTVVCIGLVFFLLREPPRIQEEKTNALYLLRNRSVLFIAGVVLTAETVLTLLEPILPVFLTERVAASPSMIGLLFAVMSVAYGAVAPLSGMLADRWNPRYLMLIGLACLAASMPLIAVSQTMWQQAGAMLLVGASVGFALSPTLSTLGTIVDSGGNAGSYGAAYSLFNMFHAVGMIVGPFLGGVLTDTFTVPKTIYLVSCALLLAGFILFYLMKAGQRNIHKLL
ncbi:MFS transporter [Paenibacillus sp. FJAT-26967]|uniref:MFS transporter n=1 Tax=Paenibacillus sp. FJAT-26967 TaxID=1729690 RepID=UPI000837F3F3|nr:MFS transporter [Paenibacillus sp. FJAT-26967]